MKLTRALIVGDTCFYQWQCKQLIDHDDVEVIGHVTTGEACASVYGPCGAQQIFIDLELTGMSSIETARMVWEQDPTVKIILSRKVVQARPRSADPAETRKQK